MTANLFAAMLRDVRRYSYHDYDEDDGFCLRENDVLAALAAAVPADLAEAVEVLRACVASLERADTAEGVCCCGDDMERHSDPMHCGHSPVDMGEYYARQAIDAASSFLAKLENRHDR